MSEKEIKTGLKKLLAEYDQYCTRVAAVKKTPLTFLSYIAGRC